MNSFQNCFTKNTYDLQVITFITYSVRIILMPLIGEIESYIIPVKESRYKIILRFVFVYPQTFLFLS